MYYYDINYINADPMPNRYAKSILDVYQKEIAILTKSGLRPNLKQLGNEWSIILKHFMETQEIDFQLAPPQIYRHNYAEHVICTFNNHLIAGS